MNAIHRIGFTLLISAVLSVVCWSETTRYEIPVEGSPFAGPGDAPLTIVEFLDYQ
jgi:hypothetical protein